MKAWITASLLMLTLSVSAQPQSKETTLANHLDFVIVSDVEDSRLSVFLSYTGKQFNHCGITLFGHSFVLDIEELHRHIEINQTIGQKKEDSGVVEGRQIKSKLNPDSVTYGQFFEIRTRNGGPLRDAIQLAARHSRRKAELIATILPCHDL